MKKFWEDPFIFTFEAVVRDVILESERIGVILEGTYFYPEGGGQPADRGTIASFPVLDVQEIEDLVIHYLPMKAEIMEALKRGTTVSCQIDQEFRINNMRLHTGSHILFGAARRLFDNVEYAGFHIGEVGNLYLETSKQIRADDLREMARIANEVIVEDRPVTASFVDPDEAGSMKELAYNLDLPKGQVRIIDVDGWDKAACSGTHMSRTSEIGLIKVIGREIHKKNVTRIDFAVGKRAVKEFARDDKILTEAAEFLSTSKDQIPQVIQKLSNDLQATQKDLRKIRERLVDYKANELKEHGEIVNGVCVITDLIEYFDSNSIKTLVTKLLAGSDKLLVAVVGGSDDLSIAAGCSQDLNLNISQSIVNIAKKYGGGGGGRPNFVTAGGIKWSATSVIAEINDEMVKLALSL